MKEIREVFDIIKARAIAKAAGINETMFCMSKLKKGRTAEERRLVIIKYLPEIKALLKRMAKDLNKIRTPEEYVELRKK